MPVDFSSQVYAYGQNLFGRPVTFYPPAPAASCTARGIYDTVQLDVAAEDGSILSDQRTILDSRTVEFTTLPVQGWEVDIPAAGSIPAAGRFQVLDTDDNGGGELTLNLRRVVTPTP